MRDLRIDPLWKAEELGVPIPPTRHGCAMCLPTWQSVIDYVERRDKVMRKLEAAYPRFVPHPDVAALMAKISQEYATEEQDVMVFPTRDIAQRAQRFLELREAGALEIKSFKGVFVLVFPKSSLDDARLFWRYGGEGISSRHAKKILENQDEDERTPACREAVASLFHSAVEDVHLWNSGMAAIYNTHRHILNERAGKKSLQVEFPYVDALKVQQSFGAGVVFLTSSKGEDLQIALERIRDREFSAVYTEVASNPLLQTADIQSISKACQMSQTPFIIDDTVASHYNVDVLPYADVVTTSLTKWVSGKGDVMAGATRINPKSAFAEEFRHFFNEQSEGGSALHPADEEVLLGNLEGFTERMEAVNKNAEVIADYLNEDKRVKEVYYPKFETVENYESVLKEGGGYGGLISIVLKNEKKSPAFYDALKLTKGPSLGTEFTLVCPFTLMAHYHELDWAETNKVSRNLVRFSIGTEPADHLLALLKEALEQSHK